MTDERGRDGAHPDPDYRFTLANERTFLAWQRTALGVIAGGVALEQFATAMPRPLSSVLGVIAVALGALIALLGLSRWSRSQAAIRAGRPLPVSWSVPVLAVGLAILALVLAVGLLLP